MPIKMTSATLTCPHCSYQKIAPAGDDCNSLWGYPALETYLQARCCGEHLWAVNIEHLNFLEDYVQAKLRERQPNINRSLSSRLPQWIKNRKNREDILRCIQQLKTDLSKKGFREQIEHRLS
jgi:hypothetical protein